MSVKWFRRSMIVVGALVATVCASATMTAGPVCAAKASAATVLTVAGAGYVSDPMEDELQGAMCLPLNACHKVDYPTVGSLFVNPFTVGLQKLTTAISTTGGPKVVMAYSQGAMVATSWLQQHASDAASPPAGEMTLVLLANPQRAKGGNYPASGLGSSTPSTQYKVVDVCREYDGECDWPTNPFNVIAIANAFMGYTSVHGHYTGVDMNAPENLIQTIGNTTYIVAPTEDLPILGPLRAIGLGGLADSMQPGLRQLIDQGYNRSGYTTIAQTGPVNPFPDHATVSTTPATTPADTPSTTQAAAIPRGTAVSAGPVSQVEATGITATAGSTTATGSGTTESGTTESGSTEPGATASGTTGGVSSDGSNSSGSVAHATVNGAGTTTTR